jgi:hypothetical protein
MQPLGPLIVKPSGNNGISIHVSTSTNSCFTTLHLLLSTEWRATETAKRKNNLTEMAGGNAREMRP